MKPILRIISLGAAVTVFATPAPARAIEFWIERSTDSAWTNRSLAELAREAEGTNAVAKFYRARASYHGLGQGRNPQEALPWLQRAAEQNLPDADYMLARFYMSGTGTGRNYTLGLQHAQRAAATGHADALAILGDAYGNGYGTPRDPEKAASYFQQAIEKGSVWALDWYGHFLLSLNLRPSGEEQAAALPYFERAASNGFFHAAAHVMEAELYGYGRPPRPDRAVYWARLGADAGDLELMEKLATLYDTGIATPRHDRESPLELWERAANGRLLRYLDQGAAPMSVQALRALQEDATELCQRYRHGVATARDYLAFARWFWVMKQAAAGRLILQPQVQPTRFPIAFDRVVNREIRLETAEDERIQKAVDLMHRATEMADPAACLDIAKKYQTGSELNPVSLSAARAWLARAAALQAPEAAALLQNLDTTLTPAQKTEAQRYGVPRKTPSPRSFQTP